MKTVNEDIVCKLSMADLANMLSINTAKPDVFDIDDIGLEIMTPSGFKPVSSYVVKAHTKAWRLGELIASGAHRVLDRTTNTWKSMIEMDAQPINEMIDVVDLEVPDGDCYIANGWVNHNTTPGGWN